MEEIPLSEAKAHLGRYLEQVQKGESFLFCNRNQPMARLVGLEKSDHNRPLRFGSLKGRFRVPDDFDAPLADFEKDFYS